MLGAIIGDIVGSIYEPRHHHIKTKDFPLFTSYSHITDDTVMSCAVAEALYTYQQSKDINLFKSELVDSMQKFGNAYPHAGYGHSFKDWLKTDHPKPYGSYGNGSAMRVSPVAYVASSLQEAEELAKASAEVTHNHPEGIKGAKAAVSATFLARIGKNKRQIKSYIEQNYYKLDFTLDEIRPHYRFDVSCQGSVPQAIVAFLESVSFEDAIRNAISIGGDSDTIAAIAGGIAEAYYGIPEPIKQEALKYVSEGLIGEVYKRFIEYCSAYPSSDIGEKWKRPSVTVDNVIVRQSKNKDFLLLIRRKNEPFKHQWALPGGYVNENEIVERAAIRELEEETGVEAPSLELVGVFSEPNRDPRGWTISCAYKANVDQNVLAHAGDDASEAEWFAVSWTRKRDHLMLVLKSEFEQLEAAVDMHIDENGELKVGAQHTAHIAFDHAKIIASALKDDWSSLFNSSDIEKTDKGSLHAFSGCLVGGAAGDALGYAVEFMSLDTIQSKYGENGITQYQLHHGQARISDDTQMTLFTANGLLLGITRGMTRGIMGSIENYVYLCYKDWLETQSGNKQDYHFSWLFHVQELHSARAPGNTCLSALKSGEMGTMEKSINHSKGCGGVMRVAPVGLYCPRKWDRTETALIGAKVAAITHGHPLGFIPAASLVDIISQIVYGEETELKEIISESTKFIVNLFKQYPQAKEFQRIMELAMTLSEQTIEDAQAIKQIGEGWVAEEALAIAVYSGLKHSSNFGAAIIAAVNHDGDSDSTGAITGNIMGAFLGYNAIPAHYLEKLELKDIILEMAEDLYNDCQISEYTPASNQYELEWEVKYINCQPMHK
ncbi:ADP-ribosylglycohydrolase family protein [Bacillus sp. AGMB 02131]|uniref:ADP-ribosylglycohydrolase family protein n=1 Tax=Peribacillus faecalis TaxID=2772559 RepID=A0A927CW23_9BACI|nr:ADP-ribosylglycohydrolase family protein [Peribacillus faecalis]MBD3108673.1 ADP-ribosylglycohydrolase family protein [Peribacillus faecalis]